MNDNINTLDADAELRLTIMASIAQEESRRTSQRVKWGQLRQMENGVVFGRSLLGYDIKNGDLSINQEGAKVVQLIFFLFNEDGKTPQEIAYILTETKCVMSKYMKTWNASCVIRILKNEKYCGDLIQKKTYTPSYLTHEKKYNYGQEPKVIIRNHHEAIVSRQAFDKAQLKLVSQTDKRKTSVKYTLSGRIRCGECGGTYIARSGTRKNGSKYLYWCCSTAKKRGKGVVCRNCQITQEELQHIIQENIRIVSEKLPVLKIRLRKVLGRGAAYEEAERLIKGEIWSDYLYKELIYEITVYADRTVKVVFNGC